MNLPEKWIWLPEKLYPEYQKCPYSAFDKKFDETYCVAEFKRNYSFDKRVVSAQLRFCGDTAFSLFLNDEILATGPATVEGDFLSNDRPRSNYYATETEIKPDSEKLRFYARVRMTPIKICEYSKGRGGFMLSALLTFSDGTKTVISTDKSWQVRYNGAYLKYSLYDGAIKPDDYVCAEEIDNIWNAKTAPLRIRTEEEIFPTDKNIVLIKPFEEKEAAIEFDKIYAGFLKLNVKTAGRLKIEAVCTELDDDMHPSAEAFVFDESCEYRGVCFHSVGKIHIKIKNEAAEKAEVKLSLIATYYPAELNAKTETSDKGLNKVLEVATHTLKYCRQLHHLDSPKHCEPLACTGDYYIESLMTAFSFGDMSLAKFDIIRTAELLRGNGGRMFHTAYSLIWVLMLHDIYMFTGDLSLLYECEDALIMLLDRFDSYIGENGIIETPPDFMFVDWIYIDELSMHHPPKALGQTCLNMFYFGALENAEKIFTEICENAMAEKMRMKKETLRKSINSLLFDSEKELYFEGLNTKTPEELIGQYMPQNTDKRYYLKHSNILAAYFGICGREMSEKLIHKIMNNECEGVYQPYFAHYLLEAIEKNGLRELYTLPVLETWKASVEKCDKGLAEGFVLPEPTYTFDHSHAWGGTPLYSLPKALLGLRILKAGMDELELSPSLLSLDYANVELPTPFGTIKCKMKKGEAYDIEAPSEIKIRIKNE